MPYLESLEIAQKIGGIVYKTSKYDFDVAKSFTSFAIKVMMQTSDQCMYEIISNQQTTYLDLDLKKKDCSVFPQKVLSNK